VRLIDADRLLDRCIFYHLPNGDLAVPIIDVQHAPTVEAPDINVGNIDAISRRQAIRWVKQECNPYGKPTLDFESGKRVMEHLEMMPSAQPERTCVTCGRTVNNGGWYADGRTRCPIEEHYALPKDGYCHLWEKRNVTDDDYPERREE
jgi:hypothetical protein